MHCCPFVCKKVTSTPLSFMFSLRSRLNFYEVQDLPLFLKHFFYKIGCTSAKISSKLGFLHSVCTILGIEEGV